MDSNSAKIEKPTIKKVALYLLKAEVYYKLYNSEKSKYNNSQQQLKLKDAIILEKDSAILQLKEVIKTIQPPWYDNFTFGFIAGVTAFLIIGATLILLL